MLPLKNIEYYDFITGLFSILLTCPQLPRCARGVYFVYISGTVSNAVDSLLAQEIVHTK